MFDKLKDVNKLRKLKSQIEKQQDQIWATRQKGDIEVTVNANKKVVLIKCGGEEDKRLKDLINDAMKEAEKKAEKKLRSQASELGLGDLI